MKENKVMTKENVKEIYTSVDARIPAEVRKNKQSAIEFLRIGDENGYEPLNKYIPILRNWVSEDTTEISQVVSIQHTGKKMTYDVEIGEVHHLMANNIVCHNTTNIPKETTEETVRAIYETAWKSGCKGMTIYRDGCRDGVLTKESAKKKDDQQQTKENLFCVENKAPVKRPKSLPCKVIRFNNHGEKWVAVIGLVDDKPYEIFTGMMDKLNLPSWVDEGFIVRSKEKFINEDGEEVQKSRYDLQYKDKDGFNVTIEGLSRTFNKEYWNYAKMISGFLRNNMPIPYVVKVISGLNLDTAIMNTWANGVVRALRRFIKQDIENTDEMNLDVCPECGKKTLKKDGACCICLNCGYSKCG